MKKIIIILLSFFTSFFISGQEEVQKCSAHIHLKELLKNNEFRKQFKQDQAQLKTEELNNHQNELNKAGTIYTIPIVFHVLHNGGVENISKAQILDAVRILNRDFRKLNSDANTVVSSFQNLVADVEIEFALATKAPNGVCFEGITRTRSPRTVDTDSDNFNGFDQIDAIVAGNDIYQGYWDPSKYLNIFVCKSIGGAAGYTNYPSSFYAGSMYGNGIFSLSNYVGSIGTSSDYTSRTLTHEVGHWINLPHTWGSTNEPALQTNCGSDDGVSDTPNTIGVQSCNLSESSCGTLANVENYMDYSYCSKMFTTGQKSRMRTALTSSIAGRNNLWSPSNLSEVGASGVLDLCKADFSTENILVCSGNSVPFIDNSIHNPTSWSWSFPGGTPSTSNSQNPMVVYNSPGEYSVSLTVTTSNNSISVTKPQYITVLSETGIAPIQEDFENLITIPSDKWFINSFNQNETWELTNAASSKSVRIDNSNKVLGSVDELISTTTTLDLNLSASISFDYAFAEKQDDNSDKLQLYVSKDCGQTWALKKSLSSSSLKTAPNTSSFFIPDDSQWKTATVSSSSLSSFLDSDFRMKFVFEYGGGNNVYIDNINIDGPVAIDEFNIISNFSLFPNPANEQVNLSFYNKKHVKRFVIKVYDVLGKDLGVVYDAELPKGAQEIKVNTDRYESGVYFISLGSKGKNKMYKFIID
jgi:PKD repeat protein